MNLAKVLSLEKNEILYVLHIGHLMADVDAAVVVRWWTNGTEKGPWTPMAELCDFHLINVDCPNSALEIWLGSGSFFPHS